MKRAMLILTICLLAIAGQSEVTFSNVTATQTPGTKRVVISYDVSSTQTNRVTVWLGVKNGTEAVDALQVTGDFGQNIVTGSGKTMIWNMDADWSKTNASLVFALGADDRIRNTPVPTGGDPLAVSWEAVNDRWVKNIYANGDITMSDRSNNRMWLYNANPCDPKNWYKAKSYCDNLTYAWYSDWYLPDQNTLIEQHSQRIYFSGVVENCYYWSSTNVTLPGGSIKAMGVKSWYYAYLGTFRVESDSFSPDTYDYFVWPVRSMQ